MSKKAQGLSINMLVVIALAVFILFLVMGFVTGGWSRFAGAFGGAGAGVGQQAAISKCQTSCAQYAGAGRPTITDGDSWEKRLCDTYTDIDINDDGTIDSSDTYSCRGATSPMLASNECVINKGTGTSCA